ncbi:MAG: helix-turn-helix domain-containing protein [Muribaculum sp.]|nr:helix-turn-helix domain-containing protein [Muribaculum sp.]
MTAKNSPESSAEAIVGRIRHIMTLRHLSQSRLAKLIGIDASNVSKYLTGRLPISESFINRIIVNLNVSKRWLQDGFGVPFEKNRMTSDISSDSPLSDLSEKAIPIYDIDVAAGITEHSREYTREHIKGHLMLPDFNPNWVAVRAQGDSMTPIIDDGAYVVFLPENDIDNIVWGQIYIIVMENRRVVKFVRRHPDPKYVILKSKNEEYDSMDVCIDDIRALYPVKAIVNVKMQL